LGERVKGIANDCKEYSGCIVEASQVVELSVGAAVEAAEEKARHAAEQRASNEGIEDPHEVGPVVRR
jgi:hypothetical protein